MKEITTTKFYKMVGKQPLTEELLLTYSNQPYAILRPVIMEKVDEIENKVGGTRIAKPIYKAMSKEMPESQKPTHLGVCSSCSMAAPLYLHETRWICKNCLAGKPKKTDFGPASRLGGASDIVNTKKSTTF